MSKPVGFQRLPGMNGVQFSNRVTTDSPVVERGTFLATDEYVGSGKPRAFKANDPVQPPYPQQLANALRDDIEQLREQGEEVVLARLAHDLGQYSNPVDKLRYIYNIVVGSSAPLYERHYIFMQIDEAVESFTEGDPFKSLIRVFDSACINYEQVYKIEMQSLDNLTVADREKIADMLFVDARRHNVPYRAYAIALLTMDDAIHRYRLLGLDDKVRAAKDFKEQLRKHARDSVDDMEPSAIIRHQFGDPVKSAEFLARQWSSWGKRQMEIVLCAGYERAAEVLRAYADVFDRIDGAGKKAAIYRKRADEYVRVGTALGFIQV